jgi:DNA-directed RNA polymerase alpha subunit
MTTLITFRQSPTRTERAPFERVARNARKLEPSNNLSKISALARRALTSAGVTQLDDLMQFSESELAKRRDMGSKVLNQLRAALEGFKESV